VTWPEGATALNRLGDLLALLGVPHARKTVEAPHGQALRVRVRGIVLDQPRLARVLYPAHASASNDAKLFLTEAGLAAEATRVLFQDGLLPWVIRTR
jgi:hypothetical protein